MKSLESPFRWLLFAVIMLSMVCSWRAASFMTRTISTRQHTAAVLPTTTILHRMISTNDDLYASSGYKKPTVQWYPGHIAKAERQLAETLRAVDVVVEVRDARAAKATSHSKVGEWCAGKPRIVVMTHVDAIPSASEREWKRSYQEFGAHKWDAQVTAQVRNQAIQAVLERQKYTSSTQTKKKKNKSVEEVSPVHNVLFVNAKQGQGIHALQRAIFKAGAHVQERRERRGLKERPLRVGIIGFPNVGKVCVLIVCLYLVLVTRVSHDDAKRLGCSHVYSLIRSSIHIHSLINSLH